MATKVSRHIVTDQPRDVIVKRLRNTLAWPRWSSMDSAVIERPGTDGPSSPGEIRRFTRGKTIGREEVLPSDGDVVLRYRLIEGLPLGNYVGEVRLTDVDGRLRIEWSASFDAFPMTGWLAALSMGRFFDELLSDLVTVAPAATGTNPSGLAALGARPA